MAKNGLAVALIDDYVDLGFGERVSDTEIRSFDGGTTLSLESEAQESLLVYVNGDLLDTIGYGDESFTEKLLAHVAAALNI